MELIALLNTIILLHINEDSTLPREVSYQIDKPILTRNPVGSPIDFLAGDINAGLGRYLCSSVYMCSE